MKMRRMGIAVMGIMLLASAAAAFIGNQVYFVNEESPKPLVRTEAEQIRSIHESEAEEPRVDPGSVSYAIAGSRATRSAPADPDADSGAAVKSFTYVDLGFADIEGNDPLGGSLGIVHRIQWATGNNHPIMPSCITGFWIPAWLSSRSRLP